MPSTPQGSQPTRGPSILRVKQAPRVVEQRARGGAADFQAGCCGGRHAAQQQVPLRRHHTYACGDETHHKGGQMGAAEMLDWFPVTAACVRHTHTPCSAATRCRPGAPALCRCNLLVPTTPASERQVQTTPASAPSTSVAKAAAPPPPRSHHRQAPSRVTSRPPTLCGSRGWGGGGSSCRQALPGVRHYPLAGCACSPIFQTPSCWMRMQPTTFPEPAWVTWLRHAPAHRRPPIPSFLHACSSSSVRTFKAGPHLPEEHHGVAAAPHQLVGQRVGQRLRLAGGEE